ncbi:MAG: protein kinase [Coriobacteriia bacterium]|nr:protein kinase [Coriobacteriia bacterium]
MRYDDHIESDAAAPSSTCDDPFIVECVLKESPVELTQLVRARADMPHAAEVSPGVLYVRKRIARASGLGTAYRTVCQAQQEGANLPHLPRVVTYREEQDALIVLLSYALGGTLRELAEGTPLALRPHLAAAVFPELCAAASELHESCGQPLVHRDLTPSNVIVDPADLKSVTLIDLGIARAHRDGAQADTTHFGTKPYAPPEQYGFGQTDVRTDVYALGMTLFFCLTGRDPESQDREAGFAAPGVSGQMREVIVRATALDPAERYGSARELSAAFGRALSGAVGQGKPSGCGMSPAAVGDAPRRGRRRPPSKLGVLFARVPRWAGRVWNVALLLAYVLLLTGIVHAIVEPTPDNARWPFWFLVYCYAVFLNVGFLVLLYLLADRRDVRSLVRPLRDVTVGREMLVGLAILLVDFAVAVTLATVLHSFGLM